MMKSLKPPKYPGKINAALAKEGEGIFDLKCDGCHSKNPGKTPWKTPVQDVHTDSKQYELLGWTADTGVLNGAPIPFSLSRYGKVELSLKVVLTSVVKGSIAQHLLPVPIPQVMSAADLAAVPGSATDSPVGASSSSSDSAEPYQYESRVLKGIWAAAPYLHNGSVSSLADLLKPASDRSPSFAIGSQYDFETVGLAKDQSESLSSILTTTDCTSRDSGNSRCGHEGPGFGTQLSAKQKEALLEYLKTL
jgi:hypothetical protein